MPLRIESAAQRTPPKVLMNVIPLTFEPNLGQSDGAARFLSHSAGYNLGLESTSASFQLNGRQVGKSATVRMAFDGANRNAQIAGEDQLAGKSNYLPTGDKKTWITNVPNYSRVHYKDIYPGVDVTFYGASNRLEYDFTVAPGADPDRVRMKLSGSDEAKITTVGDLTLRLGETDLRFLKPVVYQLSKDGKSRETISAAYALEPNRSGQIVTFALGTYDHKRRLIIDPVVALSYSQYLPSGVNADAVDSAGNTYVTGLGNNGGFYVTKFNTSGTVVYNATVGSGSILPASIVISSSGAAYIAGSTAEYSGGTVPTSTNAYQSIKKADASAFLNVLSANGSSVSYGTYLAGTEYYSDTYAYGLAVDPSGDAYLTGETSSPTFPVTPGAYQTSFTPTQDGYPGSASGFVSKINPAAPTGSTSLVYSTLLGPNYSMFTGIAVDSSGNAYVTGNEPNGFPITPGAFRYTGSDSYKGGAYVTKLNSTGTALIYSAYLGYGAGYAIAVEGQLNPSVYVTGTVSVADFPTTAGAYQTSYASGFVVKLNSTGTSEVYSTFLGGPSSYNSGSFTYPSSLHVYPSSIALPYGCSSSCNAYVAGGTDTFDYPMFDAIDTTPSPTSDSGYVGSGFVTEISATGANALFSSYLSGISSGIAISVYNSDYTNRETPSIAVDSSGDMSVAANGGGDLPISISATSNLEGGFLARIVPSSSSPFTVAGPASVSFPSQPVGVSTSQYNGPAIVHLYNLSGTAATLGTVSVSPSGVFTESDDCSGEIPAGGYCTLTLNFIPDGPNTQSGSVMISSNASNSPITIPLTGTGYETAFISASVSSLSFASQAISTTSPAQAVTISNAGDETTSLNIYVKTTDFLSVNNCPVQLLPGASCTATVTFSPRQPGLRTDTLTIGSSNGPLASVALAISGIGTVSGGNSAITLSASSLQFSPMAVSSTSSDQLVYVTNSGTYPIVLQSVTASGDFSLSNYCGTSLPYQLNPQASCPFGVAFVPTTTGTRTGTLTFMDDATGSPQTVTLSGTGVASTENVEPYPSSAVSFPDTPLTTSSASQLIYFYNTGSAPIMADRVVVSGDFQVATNCEGTTIPGITPDGSGVGSSCYVYVNFSPTATGPRSGVLTFIAGDPGTPYVVNLTGNGIAATGNIALSPDGLNFNTQADGTTSTSQYLHVVNSGNAPVTVTSFSFTGANASDFSVSSDNCPLPYTLATNSGGNCFAYIQFTPGATGSRSATFSVSTSAGVATAALAGTGVAASQAIGLTPTSMNLGTIVVGQTGASEKVYIRNTGTETVTFSAAPTVTGTNSSDFGISNACSVSASSTLAAGASCFITVAFTPGSAGTRSATLTFSDSAGTQTLALSGTGVSATPVITLSDYLISYNTQVSGTTSSRTNSIYLYNNGTTSIALGNIAVTGPFVLPAGYNTCNGQNIAAGSSCQVYVEFAPTSAGYLTGTLTFNNSSGTALSGVPAVPLAGFGVAPTYTAYIDPTALDFTAQQVVGTTSASMQVTFTNTGNTPLTVGSVTGTDFGVAGSAAEFSVASANGGSDHCSGQIVAAGGTCTVSPTFTPNAVGARTGTMSVPITYANGNTAIFTANLSGTGVVEKNSAVVTPANGSFRDQAVAFTTSYVVTSSLVNSGNQPFTVGTLVNSNTTEFSTAPSAGGSDGCSGQTVQPGASACLVNVTFTPSATGARTGSLTFPVTFADHTTASPTLALTGSGVAAVKTVLISPAGVGFPVEIQSHVSPAQTITVTNLGNAPVAFGSDAISTNSAEFAIASDSCKGTNLAVNATCNIGVSFIPGSSATGVQTGALKINDNATGGPHYVALSGTPIPGSQQIVVSQTSLAFGNQPAGSTSSPQVVYFTDQNDVPINVNSLAIGGTNAADFSITNNRCGGGLFPRSSCAVTVQFNPLANARGALTAALEETDSVAPGSHTITLTGTAIAPGPAAALSPSTYAFPTQTVDTTSAAQNFSVTNTGSANLIISMVTSTNATEFPISADSCSGATLAPTKQCIVGVKFSPTLSGTRTGSIQVTDNGGGSPRSISLAGTGSGTPAITLTPSSLTFTNTNVGSTSASQSITFKNTGPITLAISGITLTGENSSDYTETNTCSASLAPAASCVVTVSFEPTAPGTRSAYVTFTDNANNIAGSTQNAALTGTGVSTSSPEVSLSTTSLAFGNQNVGTSGGSQSVTLTNTGSSTLSIASISVTGANASQFIFANSCGASLAAGASCSIHGHFFPTVSGALTASIAINDNAVGSPQSITLTGNGTTPVVYLSATILPFGSQAVGTSSVSQSVTLTNTGTSILSIGSIGVTGANASSFLFSNTCGTTLAIGANCTIHGHFSPTAAGPLTASITITDNATDSPQTISLSGTGH